MNIIAAVVASLFATALAHADTPPVQYGPNLSLELARQAIQASEAEASKHDLSVVIAVVDTAGQLIALERMDNAQLGSLAVAQDKAVSAALYRRPTKEFQDKLTSGGGALPILALRGAVPLNGGIPILIDGRVVGAIGVSGGTSDQDGLVAKTGLERITPQQGNQEKP